MSTDFKLHHQLAADTSLVDDLAYCHCLLMEDARYPWLILVPRIACLTELHDLPTAHRLQIYDEISAVSKALQQVANAHKINVAALGNQVSQLHIHVIARQQDDFAWPGPVWGIGQAQPYTASTRDDLITALRKSFASL